MAKTISFTSVEKEILIVCLQKRFKKYAALDEIDKYKNAIISALAKIQMPEEACILVEWEMRTCRSVTNGEYRDFSEQSAWVNDTSVIYDPEIHKSILRKCPVRGLRKY